MNKFIEGKKMKKCPGSFAYTSKLSFQYGFKFFLITEVVCVCSPSTVTTAKGSGNPNKKK